MSFILKGNSTSFKGISFKQFKCPKTKFSNFASALKQQQVEVSSDLDANEINQRRREIQVNRDINEMKA
jgi:hypothetical protein